MRRALASFAAAVLLSTTAFAVAAEIKLGADEIETLLSGNTALGEYGGSPTRQYFDAGGRTDYLPKGGNVDRGRWKAEREKDQYCSWWERGGWSCYDVLKDGETYYWAQGSDYHSPFTMTPGRKMEF